MKGRTRFQDNGAMQSQTWQVWRAASAFAPALVVGLLMFAYCFPAAYVTIWPDTVRDLGASLLLARDGKIPLTGPGPINYGPYAGPAWIFLQAAPLLFSASYVATSVYVAIVASLKFPALYELGRRLSGRTLGLCMAIAAAYPSFWVWQWICFYHVNWIEASASVTLILFLIADQRRSLAWLYAAIAVLGLAVQIHTTTLFYFPLAALVLYRIGGRGPRLALHLIAMAAVILLWFVPVFFAPPVERGTLGGATHRIASDLSRFSVHDLATAFTTAWFDYPVAVGQVYVGRTEIASTAWHAGLVVVWLAIAAGAILRFRKTQHRRLFACTLALLAVAWIVGVGVRSYTSFYLLYFLLPITAIATGLCLDSTLSVAGWRAVGYAACSFLALSLLGAAYGARSVGRSGVVDSRLVGLGNLSHPVEAPIRATFMSVAARDDLARVACALRATRVTLHGELAYALSISQGLDYKLHCPESVDRFTVFGLEGDAHLAALPEAIVPALGILQPHPERGLRLISSVRPIYPPQGRSFEKRFSYFEHLDDRKPMQVVVVDFETQPQQIVAVYRHKPFDSHWVNFSVTQQHGAAVPASTTFNSWLYRTGDQTQQWRVQVETDAPQWIEVFVLGLS
jgi:hypothetical protein